MPNFKFHKRILASVSRCEHEKNAEQTKSRMSLSRVPLQRRDHRGSKRVDANFRVFVVLANLRFYLFPGDVSLLKSKGLRNRPFRS